MPNKKYSHLQIHKALKIVLGINYHFKWLDVEISPNSTVWYTAVQFRNDKGKNWHPRVTVFYPGAQRVAVLSRLGDPDPTWVDAETIVAMAQMRAQTPTPPRVPGPA
jgi:hypothetical protein